MKEVVIVGGGTHAKSVISILKKIGNYKCLGYTDLLNRGTILGLDCLGRDEDLEELLKRHPHCAAVIGIGSLQRNRKRAERFAHLEEIGFELPAVISPNAIVNEEVNIDKGTVVMDGAIINSGSQIGRGSIINTNSTIEHDSQIGNYVHIASGATLGGGVRVGHYTTIGTGASVKQNVSISDDCVIGIGAAVVKDCLISGTYVGVPARMKP